MSKQNKQELKKETIEIDPRLKKHTPIEDLQAFIIGSLLVGFGVSIFTHLKLLTGGTAGNRLFTVVYHPLQFRAGVLCY